MKKATYTLFLATLLMAMLSTNFVPQQSAKAQLELPPGVKREEVLIHDPMGGRKAVVAAANWFAPGREGEPWHNFVFDHLWDINTTTGEFINALARAPPEELPPYNLTKWRFYLREGIYWTDGVEFTADDVVFTIDMLRNTPGLTGHEYFRDLIKEAKVIDKHTVELELKRPCAKLQEGYFGFGVVVWGGAFIPVPKHIWEKIKDPVTFTNFPPVTTGPYTVKDYDPDGFWYLLERREDWQRTPVGQVVGMPAPKYVLSIYYGPEEKKVLAMIRHELDVSTDITPEAMFTLLEQNPYARAWYPYYPYGWFDDPCERGINFNLLNYPYNITEVRWALALSINITEASITMYNGMLRMSPLHIPPINVFNQHYFWPLEPWLRDFELPVDPGYKPFDPEPPVKIANYVKKVFPEEPVPTDPRGARELFGIGWWKYDPAEAEKLLKKVGFTRDADGNWFLPTGERWKMVIVAPTAYEYESMRVGYICADHWRRFGIDASAMGLESGAFWSYYSTGEYDAGAHWPGCGQIVDLYSEVQDHLSSYIVPTGQVAPGNSIRWNNSVIDRIATDIEFVLPSDYERLEQLGEEYLQTCVRDMPHIPMFGTTKIVPCDTYYWENLPTATNMYAHPIWWWSAMKYQLPMYKPSGRTPAGEIPLVSVWIAKAVAQFVGVDGKTYGPFTEGEYVTIPRNDADRLIEEGSASSTPPLPPEIKESIANIIKTLDTVSGSVTALSDTVTGQSSRIATLESTLYAALAVSIISVVLAVVAIIRASKKA